jgi:hypothetical protein
MPEEALEPHELREKLEQVEEHLEHEGPSWTMYLSLSTAIVAVFAAVASLQSGGYANHALLEKNEAVLLQAKATDEWSLFQAKSVKAVIYTTQADLFPDTAAAKAADYREKAAKYKTEQEEIEHRARELEKEVTAKGEEAQANLEKHHKFARSVTVFQIAIALAAIGALTRRKPVWYLSLLVAAGGVAMFAQGFMG